ncbi:MAG: DEAD/DEAH box helicase [Blastochloris viridis]|uniref:DEAD/DEAH box helicase n=1 Tax=Blastochloris viridis TaxID=1079 RepID=A0A6N4RBC3_BLAVI|nr:MAG: DEAD/DEAH box helicase [Blastochloris viridis]
MLKPPLQKAIADAGFTTPTPIQAQSIPGILEGRDAMACAPTGTGKTAAFVLPALNLITSGPSQARGHGPRVLVLTPTRELAEQIITNVKLFSKHSRIASGLIMGGVSYGPQYKLLSNPLDMLVATPGRLIDHLNERKIDLSRVEMLVLDEADRMLDMGFLKPVEKIIAALARKPQTLLFSATFEAEIEKVAQRVLTNPVRVQLAAPKQSHSSITHHAYMVDNTGHKQALLNKLLREKDVQQAIVFTATKRIADQLAEHLHGRGFSASALHGDMKQNARKRTLEGLHKGTLQVLVATDVAARGIDVKNLSHVFNYDLPNAADDFTHRIGRTGRGGSEGIAISLVAPPDLPLLKAIEKRQGKNFNFVSFEGLEPVLSEQDFRALVPTEPPPGRPKPKGQRGGGRPQGGFSGRSFGGNRSEGGRSEGGRSDKPRGFSGGNRSEGRSEYRDNGNRTEGRGERSDNRGNRFEGRSEGRSDSRPDNRFGGRSEGRSDKPRGFSGGKPARREGGNGASRSASSRPARRPSR